LEQVALITGAGQGVGAATAKLFASEGASVVVADLDAAKATQVCCDRPCLSSRSRSVGLLLAVCDTELYMRFVKLHLSLSGLKTTLFAL
jgi:3-oxoacyl-[acyl-carrier protein] reductase